MTDKIAKKTPSDNVIQEEGSGMSIIALIDNYDSFTYNIYQAISQIIEKNPGEEVRVFRNDEICIDELAKLNPGRLIISPGPGVPSDAGISVEAVKFFTGKIPILGICLGHQALAEAFGGVIVQAKAIVHGKVDPISIDGKGVLRNLPNPCKFTRYHSLAVDPSSMPPELEISAYSNDGEIMGLRHREYPIEGVQFHPESIGSEHGMRLLSNFLNWRRVPVDHQGLLNKVIAGEDLTSDEAAAFMDELTEGSLEDAYIAGMLCAMAAKGYSADEVAGCVSILIQKRRPVELGIEGLLDNCGTGGDNKHTFNISSFAALIASACGAVVAKHGNRAVSSKSGSTDFYKALGIPTDLEPAGVAASIREEGFGYMAAPIFHGSMRYAAPARKALGVKTIMNCLGPLANPASAEYRIIGVYNADIMPVMARAAKKLGVKRVICVHSEDGLDEISPSAPTKVFMIDEKDRENEEIFDPGSLDIKHSGISGLVGGDAAENARLARDLLRGTGSGILRDAVCLNAGGALYAAALAGSIAEGYRMARAALEDGRVQNKLEALKKRALSNGREG